VNCGDAGKQVLQESDKNPPSRPAQSFRDRPHRPTYNERNERMIGLYALKPWYTRMLTPILNTAVAQKVSPDVFTAAGVVAAGAAGPPVALGW
jgi:hypothetical protein